jgi:DNA-binding CsgD family transcriptional regulator
VEQVGDLDAGREAYTRRAWTAAFERLSRADRVAQLGAADLELLATAAYMVGREHECDGCRERAFQLHLGAGALLPAARSAFWLGNNLMLRGEMAPATGWFARARRLVERAGGDCVEQGYLLLPAMIQQRIAGDLEAAAALAAAAAAAGERFGDADLFALATTNQGILLALLGRVAEALELLDEAMLAVTTSELSPIINGYVYCGVITGCRVAHELRRAHEWTAALTRWCDQQPDLVSFTGTCLVHRAELMQLHGAWLDALSEARRAGERCEQALNRSGAAEAMYLQGEVHRLQGDHARAEEAYREASVRGFEPQPGLALLRLAQGSADAAEAAIRRVMGETSTPSRRADLLPAYIEIMLAVGDLQTARSACAELEELAARHSGGALDAAVAHARGAVDLAGGETRGGLVSLRRAWQAWQELEAPYEAARVRVEVGRACRALGDEDAAGLELEAARGVFAELGAATELQRVESLLGRPASAGAHGLTPRELQVLRLVAAGARNRAIAGELVLSERTVERHLANIFAKLRVSTRAAATAYAYEHGLL